jgi:transcriptional regulator with XRE-family HTH domain
MAFDRSGFERAVGMLLQAARQKRGMTQEQLAEAIGVPRASYANLEAGRQRIPVDIIWRVAVVLGVSVISLLPEPTYRPKHESQSSKNPGNTAGTTAQDLVSITYRTATVN